MQQYKIKICYRNTDFFVGVLLPALLNPNPTSELEKVVNDLRTNYKTYVVELDTLHVRLSFQMLLFGSSFPFGFTY